MDAIVLTCDRFRALTEHMIYQYDRLWPDHGLRFLIPFQDDRGVDTRTVKFIRSEPSIKQTVLTLLAEFDDEDWIYWAIDDKYPVILNVPQIMTIRDKLLVRDSVNGVLFCRCRNLCRPECLNSLEIDSEGHRYLGRRGYDQIWIHQFLRVKILRRLFSAFPNKIDRAKDLDELKGGPNVPAPELLFVSERTFAVFGESTSRGILTQNCWESIVNYGLRLPSWFRGTTGARVLMGWKEYQQARNAEQVIATVNRTPSRSTSTG